MSDINQTGVMIIGEKESFLILTLIKKLAAAGLNAFFTRADVDSVSSKWENSDVIILYMDGADTTMTLQHYLKDKLSETNRSIILVGERDATEKVKANIGGGHVAKTFTRPLQTEQLIEALKEQTRSLENGVGITEKPSVLVVDDDASYLGLVREWLKDDYRIGMARSGMQAITWLARNSVDLILLDYEMPVTSGAQVFEMLKSEQYSRDIPVMFLTGTSDRDSIMKVMELKPAGYMLKNITQKTLLSNLDKFFVGQKYNT